MLFDDIKKMAETDLKFNELKNLLQRNKKYRNNLQNIKYVVKSDFNI